MNQTSSDLKNQLPSKEQFKEWVPISLRWADNDQYGHVNNVVYYSYFDTAVNQLLIEHNLLNPTQSEIIGLVVQTHCEFCAPLSFPGQVDVGIRVGRIGTSSVRYELGIFSGTQLCAYGHFVHVYVDAKSRRPVSLAPALKKFLEALV